MNKYKSKNVPVREIINSNSTNVSVRGTVKVQRIVIECVTERVAFPTFDRCHQIHVVRLSMTRNGTMQIRLSFVQFLDQLF